MQCRVRVSKSQRHTASQKYPEYPLGAISSDQRLRYEKKLRHWINWLAASDSRIRILGTPGHFNALKAVKYIWAIGRAKRKLIYSALQKIHQLAVLIACSLSRTIKLHSLRDWNKSRISFSLCRIFRIFKKSIKALSELNLSPKLFFALTNQLVCRSKSAKKMLNLIKTLETSIFYAMPKSCF